MKSPPISSHFLSATDDIERLLLARRNKAEHIVGLLRPILNGNNIRSVMSIGSSYCLIEERMQRDLVPDTEFICTDVDALALYHFDQPGLTKRVLSATELDYPDAAFDLIIAHQVLEHINGFPGILERLRYLCRIGGSSTSTFRIRCPR